MHCRSLHPPCKKCQKSIEAIDNRNLCLAVFFFRGRVEHRGHLIFQFIVLQLSLFWYYALVNVSMPQDLYCCCQFLPDVLKSGFGSWEAVIWRYLLPGRQHEKWDFQQEFVHEKWDFKQDFVHEKWDFKQDFVHETLKVKSGISSRTLCRVLYCCIATLRVELHLISQGQSKG